MPKKAPFKQELSCTSSKQPKFTYFFQEVSFEINVVDNNLLVIVMQLNELM